MDENNHETEVREEASRDLTRLYIAVEDAIKKGITRLEIRQQVLDQGWTSEEIDKAFIKHDVERLSRIALMLENQFKMLKEGKIPADVEKNLEAEPKVKPVPKHVSKHVKKHIVHKKPVLKHKHYHHRFIASKLTKRYHRFDCKFGGLIDKKDKRTFASEAEAKLKGYVQCSVCIGPLPKAPAVHKRHKHYHHRVVGSSTSLRYHHFDCKFSKLIEDKDKKHFDNESDAESKGYKPCKACINIKLRIIASKGTHKYHQPGCRFLKSIKPKDKERFYDDKEAKKAGYLPCASCNNVIIIVREKKERIVKHKHYHHRYVGSVDGGHYHTYNCHWGDSIDLKKQRFFNSMAQAQRKGYKACDKCIKSVKPKVRNKLMHKRK